MLTALFVDSCGMQSQCPCKEVRLRGCIASMDKPLKFDFAVQPFEQAAASAAGRRVTVLREAGASPDHTLNPAYPEGKYLTNVLLHVV